MWSHSLRHSSWKMCVQWYSLLTHSPSRISWQQIIHSGIGSEFSGFSKVITAIFSGFVSIPEWFKQQTTYRNGVCLSELYSNVWLSNQSSLIWGYLWSLIEMQWYEVKDWDIRSWCWVILWCMMVDVSLTAVPFLCVAFLKVNLLWVIAMWQNNLLGSTRSILCLSLQTEAYFGDGF